MTWIRVVLKELWGLFVDDGPFASLILIWLAVVATLPGVGVPDTLTCLVFAAGLAALLVASTLYRAGK
jgi:hypothetical protein